MDDVKQTTEYSLSVVAKLVEAFHNDYDISTACRHAHLHIARGSRWLIRSLQQLPSGESVANGAFMQLCSCARL